METFSLIQQIFSL